MDIFGIGPGELMLILVLALVIVGPQKLPEMGRTIGKAVGEFKAQTDAFRSMMTLDPPAAGSATPAPPAPLVQTVAPSIAPLAPIYDERVVALQTFSRRSADTTPAVFADETSAVVAESQAS